MQKSETAKPTNGGRKTCLGIVGKAWRGTCPGVAGSKEWLGLSEELWGTMQLWVYQEHHLPC